MYSEFIDKKYIFLMLRWGMREFRAGLVVWLCLMVG